MATLDVVITLVLINFLNIAGRPVGVAERDVYVCEARYNEADKQIRKLKGLKVVDFLVL